MIEDDGGFMRRETQRDWDGFDPDEPCCAECGSTEDNCPCEVFISEDKDYASESYSDVTRDGRWA